MLRRAVLKPFVPLGCRSFSISDSPGIEYPTSIPDSGAAAAAPTLSADQLTPYDKLALFHSQSAWSRQPFVLRNPDITKCTQKKSHYIHVETGKKLRCVYNPNMEHRGTVIFLHGLGFDGESTAKEFEDVAACLPHVKFVFPTARRREMRFLSGKESEAWFGLDRLCIVSSMRNCDEPSGIEESIDYVHTLADYERSLLPEHYQHNIVIGGFSCGGAAAILAAHTYNQPIVGCLAMSGYCAARRVLQQRFSPVNKRMPVLITHGDMDPVVPLSVMKSTLAFLSELKADTNYERCVLRSVYPKFVKRTAHGRCPEEFTAVAAFVQQRIPGGYEENHDFSSLRGALQHKTKDKSSGAVDRHFEYPNHRRTFGGRLKAFEEDSRYMNE